jgi:hypothetical protein
MNRTRFATVVVILVLAGCSEPHTPSGPASDAPGNPSPPTIVARCNGGSPSIVVLVDTLVIAGIRSGLDRFERDLCADGYTALELASPYGTPPDVRDFLARTLASTSLAGAILIGNVPHAYQHFVNKYTNPNIPPDSEEVISFQYYADLNGTFSTTPGYVSMGRHTYSYNVHTGDTNWEIWIGVLPYYRGDRVQTISALNRYFDKNHAYRTGGPKPPRRFLEVDEYFTAVTVEDQNALLATLRNGPYSWMPFSTTANALFFFAGPPGGLTQDQGYAALSSGMADFTVTDTHGFWGAGGKLTIAWAETMPVRTIFYWSNGCAVGDLDHAENFLTSMLYSPTSDELVANGTTNNSGGMGNNENGFFGRNIATAMSQQKSFGDAVLSHVNVPLIYPWNTSRELHMATPVILGDPTLKLR